MVSVKPAEHTSDLLEEIERCDALAARAREQTSFSAAVVQHVVRELSHRRDVMLGVLAERLPDLIARGRETQTRVDETAREIDDLQFRLDEVELRTAIGEIDEPTERQRISAALADALQHHTSLQSDNERLQALISRCISLSPSGRAPSASEGLAREKVSPSGRAPECIRGGSDARKQAQEGLAHEKVSTEGLGREKASTEDPWDEEVPAEAQQATLLVDVGGDNEHQVTIAGDRLTIGRGARSDLQLRGDSKVSRSHLTILREQGLWWLQDHSANHTLVNGELIIDRRRLYGGEELIVGESFLRFLFC